MADLGLRVAGHLDRTGLLPGPGAVLVAVSGGADSLALLDLLDGLAPARGLTLLVAHADHGIHPDSGRVADDVVRVARERYGLETVVGRLALGAEAGETHARDARYAFLRGVQASRGARFLVTAHHADDQVETVLLRVLRGSGPAGLAGIGASGPDGLVRPLLPFTRAELAAHVRAAGLVPYEDPANADPRHLRSWVRATLLPLLDSRVEGGAAAALRSVAQHAAAELAAWDAALEVLPLLDLHVENGLADVARAGLSGYDSVLAARLLRAAARRAGLLLAPAQAERIVEFAPGAASGRRLELGDGLVAEAAFERLLLRRLPAAPAMQPLAGEAGQARFGGFEVRWRPEPAPARLDRGGWTTWIAPGPLELAPPPAGERIVPLGGTGRRAVTKLLMEERIPRGERPAWPAVRRDGATVWIPGICRAQAAIPEPGTLAVRMDVAAAR